MEVKGLVHEIGENQQVTDSFVKRELVLEIAENPQYPEHVKFEAIQDKTKLFDELRVGDNVEVQFNLKGRAWTDKTGKKQYFNTLQVWKININQTAAGEKPVMAKDIDFNADDDDSLPF